MGVSHQALQCTTVFIAVLGVMLGTVHCTVFMVKNWLREVGDWFTRRGQCQQPGAAKGRFEVLSTWCSTGRLPT